MSEPSPGAPLAEVERRLGYAFADRQLLRTALTHGSWAHERGERATYERLEFLGDAVVALVAARWLFSRSPEHDEGDLSHWKSYLVSAPLLADAAEALALGESLRLGVGEDRSGGRRKASLLADVFEAVVGAVFLDGGLLAAERLVEPLLERAASRRSELLSRDAKSRLQEAQQSRGGALPRYVHAATEGPDHEKLFTVECWLGEELAGAATGPSKKVAEQRAAAVALEALALR